MEIRSPARPQAPTTQQTQETATKPPVQGTLAAQEVAAVDDAKMKDSIAKAAPGSLVATLLQAAAKKELTPGAEGSSAIGLAEFGALKELLGAPKPNVPAAGFEPRGGNVPDDVVLSPHATVVFLNIAKGDLSGLIDPEALQNLAAQAESKDPTVRAEATNKANELRQLFVRCDALVEKFFSKATELTPEKLLARQPPQVQAALQKALPKIIDSLRATFKEIDAQLKNKKLDDVVLPSALVVQAEQAFQPVLAEMTKTEQAIAQIKQDPAKFQQLQQGLRQLRETGKTDVPPEIAAVAKEVVAPVGEEKTKPAEETSKTSSFDEMLRTGDIESLMYWVMSQVAESAEDELRGIMKDMQAQLDLKKAQREKITAMKQQKAELDMRLRGEYNELRGQGLLHSSVTFEEYAAWRPVQSAEDGSAQLAKITSADIPVAMREGPPQTAIAQSTGATPTSFDTLPNADMVAIGKKYGINANDAQYLYSFYQWARARPEGGGKIEADSFTKFLEGKDVGLKAGGKDNGAAVQKFFDGLDKLKQQVADYDKKHAGTATPPPDPDVTTYTVDGKSVTRTKFASANDIDKMTDAELSAFYANLRTTLPGTTLPATLDDFRNQVKAYIKAACGNGSATNTTEAIRQSFDRAPAPLKAVMQGIFAEVRERMLTKFVDAVKSRDINVLRNDLGLSVTFINAGFFKVLSVENWTTNPGITNYSSFNEDWTDRAQGRPSKHTTDNLGPDYLSIKTQMDSDYTASVQGQETRKKAWEDEQKAAAAAAPKAAFLDELKTKWGDQRELDSLAADAKAQAQKEDAASATAQREATDAALRATGEVAIDKNGKSADGRSWRMGTMATFEADLEGAQSKLDTLGDQTEIAQTRLQMYMDRRAKAFETLSNVMKKMSQTQEQIIGNMK